MDDVDTRRRGELGAFLRKARARVSPETAGIGASGKRKTPGLRREEVAELAGVSAVWYTWLEQGRDIQASVEVLTALCSALRLSKSETEYVLRVGRPPFLEDTDQIVLPEGVERLLESVNLPTYVVDRCWNIIKFNRGADLLFGLTEIPLDERNPLKMVWQSGAEEMIEDWAVLARRLLAEFRSCYALNPADPRFLRIADELSAWSPLFAQWWAEQQVDLAVPISRASFLHPVAGLIAVHNATMQPIWAPEIVVHMFAPVDEVSAGKLAALLALPAPSVPVDADANAATRTAGRSNIY